MTDESACFEEKREKEKLTKSKRRRTVGLENLGGCTNCEIAGEYMTGTLWPARGFADRQPEAYVEVEIIYPQLQEERKFYTVMFLYEQNQ